MDSNSLQDAVTYIRAMTSTDLYVDLGLGDRGKGLLGGSVLYRDLDSTSHAQTQSLRV